MMGIDLSIYQHLLRKPRSVADYDAEAQTLQQNALAMRLNQAKLADYERGQAEEGQYRQTLNAFGSDPAGTVNALVRMGRFQEAQQIAGMLQKQQQARADQQASQRRGSFLDSINPNAGPSLPFNPASALAAGLSAQEVGAFQPKIAPPGSAAMQPDGTFGPQVPFKPEARKLPPLGELQVYRDGLPANDPRRREVQSVINNQTRAPKYASAPGGPAPAAAALPKPAKPLPAAALKMQQEAVDAIGISSSINADLSALEKQIDDKKLSFGPVDNLVSQGRNMVGMSNEGSRNFATFRSNMERLRNESLRLNTGVQTDGDAQRAWNELFQNITDTKLVKQRLGEIQRINKRGVELQQLRIDGIRNNYGLDPMDTTPQREQPPALNGGGALSPDEAAELEALRKQLGRKR